jgi:replicative DNA helicase
MVADACNIACDEIYDPIQNKWIPNGTQEPTIYVMTEQIFSEVQTMMWAFLSAVPEDHILTNRYAPGEIERITRAREIIKRSPLYLKELHDFSLKDIENVVKLAVRKYKVRYFFLDYIHSSMKILSEVSSRASVKGLREDNVLFMISVRLKDLATDNGIFIMSSTQLNADYQNASVYDQNLLRGAKAIADKIDMGSIMLRLNDSDIEMIKPLAAEKGIEMPNLKISIYKNRRGRYNHILLWCNADLGTCRINPLFATDYGYNIIEMENYKINITPRKESAF